MGSPIVWRRYGVSGFGLVSMNPNNDSAHMAPWEC